MPELVRAALRVASSRSSEESKNHPKNNNKNTKQGGGCPYAAAWSSSSSQDEETTNSTTTAATPATTTPHSATPATTTTASMMDPAVWELARTSCPAFETSCPFSHAKNATEVRQTLLQLPSSHWQASYFYQALQHLHLVVQQEPTLQQQQSQQSQQQQSEGGPAGAVAAVPSDEDDDRRGVHSTESSNTNEYDDNNNNNNDDDAIMGDDSEQYRIPGGCPIKHFTTSHIYTNNNNNNNNSMRQPLLPPGIQSFGQAMEECSLAAIMARMAKELEQEQDDKEQPQPQPQQQISVGGNGDTIPITTDDNQSSTDNKNAIDPTSTTIIPTSFESSSSSYVPPPPPPPPPSTPSLAQALKTGTAASHEAAEHVHFVRNFIRGSIDRDLYAQLVLSLYHVYHTLEDLLDQQSHHFDAVHFPQQLHRTAALLEDVDFWWGGSDQQQQQHRTITSTSTMTPATRDYVTRLHQIAQDDPVLLVAHAYTRYLGDLSGGRILARVAKKALHLEDDNDNDNTTDNDHQPKRRPYTEGLAFYHFEHVPNPKEFKDTYRRALDDLPALAASSAGGSTSDTDTTTTTTTAATSTIIDKLVLEANVAFLLNMRLFEELDVMANVPGAYVRPMDEVLEQAAVAMSSSATTNRGQGGKSGVDKQQQPTKKTLMTSNSQQQQQQGGATSTAGGGATTCPFAYMGKERPASTVAVIPKVTTVASTQHDGSKRCPWPFVFFHDPVQGLKDWQTWCVVGVILAWLWNVVS